MTWSDLFALFAMIIPRLVASELLASGEGLFVRGEQTTGSP
jgi:hypothetical protein